MMDRQNDNRRVVMYLFDMVEKYPDLRFGQILSALQINTTVLKNEEPVIVDEFYLEPGELLKRVEIAAEKLLKESL
jgi:hypothetical protein